MTANSSINSSSSSNVGSTVRDASEKFRDKVSDTMNSERAREMVDQATEMAGDLYKRASTFIQGDTGKVVGVVAAIAAVGLFGFFLGRSSASSSSIENY